MTDYYQNRKYFVYRHVAPNGKMYVGITSKSNPIQRWGTNGIHYKNNKHFWNAIQKFGWDNFSHIIVAHGLSVDTACHLEEYLIKKYDSMTTGYNQTSGGVCPTEVTDEIRGTISEKVRKYHNSLPEGAWSNKFKGHYVSDVTKKKISNKSVGRRKSQETIDKQVSTFKANLTPDIRYRMGSSLRGKHLSEATKEKIRIANTGRKVSQSTKELIGKLSRERYFYTTYVWVNNGNIETEIDSTKLSDYLSNGYQKGRLNNKCIYVHKDGVTIKIMKSELDTYLSDGWFRGFGDDRYANIKKSKQIFVYFYGDVKFYSGKELAGYLRNHGYPKIVQGTINNICNGVVCKAYPELSDKIYRRRINEDI